MWNQTEFPRLRFALLLAGLGQLLLLTEALLLLPPTAAGLWRLWLPAGQVLLDLLVGALLVGHRGLPEEFAFLLPLALLQLLGFGAWQLWGEAFYLFPVVYWLGRAGCLTWLSRGTGRVLWKLGRSYEAVGGMALWILYCLGTLLFLLRELGLLSGVFGAMLLTAELVVCAAAAAFLLLSIYWLKKGSLKEEE